MSGLRGFFQSQENMFVSDRDGLIELTKQLIRENRSIEDGFKHVDELIAEHIEWQETPDKESRLQHFLKGFKTGYFFTPLPVLESFYEYNRTYALTNRKYISPSFREIRHIFNTAQIHGICNQIKLATFDADGTIYEDGAVVEEGSPFIDIFVRLMQAGVTVAIVTAAGYPHNPRRYEERIHGLLLHLKQQPIEIQQKFFIMGGECNYLFKMDPNGNLYELPDSEWKSPEILSWKEEDIQLLLDQSENLLKETINALKIDHKLTTLRKERAIGCILRDPMKRVRQESLNELALTVQHQIKPVLPYCAFNSGSDVWVDIGNKKIGVQALQRMLKLEPQCTLHSGDQLTSVGNDFEARNSAATLWVTRPKETLFFMEKLLAVLEAKQN